MVKFLESATILEVKDVVVSERFYREKLGFGPGKFFGEPPTFCILCRDTVTGLSDKTRTSSRSTPLNQYWALYVYVDDVDALAGRTREKPAELPWSARSKTRTTAAAISIFVIRMGI